MFVARLVVVSRKRGCATGIATATTAGMNTKIATIEQSVQATMCSAATTRNASIGHSCVTKRMIAAMGLMKIPGTIADRECVDLMNSR